MVIKKQKFVGALLLIALASPCVARIRSEWALHSLLQAGSREDDSGPGLPQDPATFARWRRFDILWQARTKQDVTAQLLPFLSDPFLALRERAVRSLGKLENPKAQPALRALLSRMGNANAQFKPGGVSPLLLKLALGRINSRNLKGQAKVSASVKEVGLTWPDAVRLVERVNRLQPLERTQTEGDEIVNSLISLLSSMAERSENVRPLVQQLSLRPSQQVQIQAAPLSTDQEVAFILKSLLQFKVFVDSEQLSNRLMDLRPRSTELLLRYLQDASKHPEKYRKTSVENFSLLFRLAAQMDDPRVIPLLKKFEANPKPWPDLRREAQIAEEIAQNRVRLLSNAGKVGNIKHGMR